MRDPWVSFLDQRGIFTGFASEYLTLHGRVTRSFEPDSSVLDLFRQYLGRQQVRVPEEYWTQDQDYLKLKIKAEVLNLVFGLAVGDKCSTSAEMRLFSKPL